MDSRGKPQISSKLLQRMTSFQKPKPSFGVVSSRVTSPRRAPDKAKNGAGLSPASQQVAGERTIRSYGYSQLGTQYIRSGVRQYGTEMGYARRGQSGLVKSSSNSNIGVSDVSPRVQTGQNRPSAGFREPPSRRHDPYA